MPKPTKAMQTAAKRGLKMRKNSSKSKKGGTRTGVARANQFADRDNVSMETVKRTYSFLSRAKTYYKKGKNTPGTQAYLLWGGNAALRWSKRILGK